jgi:hypothetical protein
VFDLSQEVGIAGLTERIIIMALPPRSTTTRPIRRSLKGYVTRFLWDKSANEQEVRVHERKGLGSERALRNLGIDEKSSQAVRLQSSDSKDCFVTAKEKARRETHQDARWPWVSG